MSGVVHSVGNFLTGGSPKQLSAYGAASPQEQQVIQNLTGQINSEMGQQQSVGQNEANLFNQHLNDFLGMQNQIAPTQQEMTAAQNTVDQTFTQPAQQALAQQSAQFGAAQNAKAAALGLNPNANLSTQIAEGQFNAGNQLALQNERGARIMGTANDLMNQQYGRASQSTGFLNDLTQQAFNNRMGLMNQSSRLGSYYLQSRGKLGQMDQGSAGLLPTLGSSLGQGASIFNAAKTGSSGLAGLTSIF